MRPWPSLGLSDQPLGDCFSAAFALALANACSTRLILAEGMFSSAGC